MRLTGSELIRKLASFGPGVSEPERIRATGYAFTREGKERLCRASFYKALALADPGLNNLAGRQERSTPGRRGPGLSYETAVLGRGHAVIGRPYLNQIGVRPGGRIQITISDGGLHLQKLQ